MAGTCNAGEESHTQKYDLDIQRRLARENRLEERRAGGAKLDLEEVRRIAREESLSKYAK